MLIGAKRRRWGCLVDEHRRSIHRGVGTKSRPLATIGYDTDTNDPTATPRAGA
jgi:hypothetical protein